MFHLRRLVVAIILIVASWFTLTALHQHLDPNKHKTDEQREDARWIATSKYWLDRNACRWMGLCGLAHYHPDPPAGSRRYRPRADLKRRGRNVVVDEPDNVEKEHDMGYAGWGDGFGREGKLSPDDFVDDDRVLKDVPQFVLDAAPLIHLYSKEEFWPSDIGEHLLHTEPYTNHTTLNISDHTVYNLHELNEGRRGRFVFMQSQDDVESRPSWLGSSSNKPKPYPEDDEEEEDVETHIEFVEAEVTQEDKETWFDPYGPGPKVASPNIASPKSSSFRVQAQTFQAQTPRRQSRKSRRDQSLIQPPFLAQPSPSGRSPAPAILILVDKGHGILDAFWFYFYSYNLGTTVLNIRFGNHIGDWEHSLIRFHHGVPKAVFFSAHSGGTAYSYNAVEKGKGPGREGRPVLYSAFGSHAMYAMPGKHPYILPFGLLADVTDKGPLWDPALNYYAYHFNTSITHDENSRSLTTNLPLSQRRQTLQPASKNPSAPTGWFWFTGHWGDKFYELRDWRQWRFVGQYHYVNGPLGPRFKNLGRSKVCQSGLTCTILDSIEEGKKRSWLGKRSVRPRSLRVGEVDDVA
jgi:hypothetical protein